MSNQDEPPQAADPNRSYGSTYPPVPPRSRRAGHVVGIVAGLLLPPVFLVLVALGWSELTGGAGLLGLAYLLLGVAVLAGLAAVAALGSSLALVVGGLVWGVAGHLGRDAVGPALTDATSGVPATLGVALTGPLYFAPVAVLGVTMVAGGMAVHLARRAGRRQERVEARQTRGTQVGEAPVPPGSRRWAHVLGTVLALVATVVALLVLARDAGAGGPGWTVPVLVGASVLLAAAALVGAVSSLGPQVAGWGLLVAPAMAALWFTRPGSPEVLAPVVETLFRLTGGPLLTVTGTLLLLGLTLAIGGAAAHWARRAGRRYERVDLALTAR
ncbi:hypothetical protein [Georgenia subflava]|uniref:Uncharacterized protein n=1 Tax=Georgenia subflava TaxID=1622177 RepID=A0A6N7EKR0_9MICO|nr:hypothetical protein [Georgenia subflava]MPV37397.1 hypothetical protein [Georgenia subflava]